MSSENDPEVPLAARDCPPCRGGIPPLRGDALHRLNSQLGAPWQLVADHHLQRAYSFPDFAQALSFTNAVGAIAEEQNHHPELHLGWGHLLVEVWTHKIDGLTEADFVLAARIEEAYRHAM